MIRNLYLSLLSILVISIASYSCYHVGYEKGYKRGYLTAYDSELEELVIQHITEPEPTRDITSVARSATTAIVGVTTNVMNGSQKIFNRVKKSLDEQVEQLTVSVRKVKARKIRARKIRARKIEARKIEARKIEARRIEARRIEARRIEARRIEAKQLEMSRQHQQSQQQVPRRIAASAPQRTGNLVSTDNLANFNPPEMSFSIGVQSDDIVEPGERASQVSNFSLSASIYSGFNLDTK